MSLKRIKYHLIEKLPLIVGIGLIISIHWTWLKLQDVPHLVSKEEKKDEFPLFAAIRLFAGKKHEPDVSVTTSSKVQKPE